jgi:hypothetical protein
MSTASGAGRRRGRHRLRHDYAVPALLASMLGSMILLAFPWAWVL